MIDDARIGGSSPSYLHSLALIGQYFNQQHARLVTIAEVDTGYLLFFFADGNWRKPRSVALHYADLLELTGPFQGASSGNRNGVLLRGGDTRDKRHPLLPMGYDRFLRTLGYKLDRRRATGLTLCETRDRLYINFWLDKATFIIRDQRRQAVSAEQMDVYDAAGILKTIATTQEGIAQEALRYDQGMKMNQYDHITALSASFLLENEGNYPDAETILTRIVTQVPEHPEAHYHIARLAISRGDRRGALTSIRRALTIRDDLAPLHDLHGRILRQQRQHKAAVAAFQEALTLDPEHGIYHYHLAQTYETLGRKDEAAAEMALSSTQSVAPAWDMVQEELAVDAAPATRLGTLEPVEMESPAASALLPPLPPEPVVAARGPAPARLASLAGSAVDNSPAASALLPPLPKEEQPAGARPVYQANWDATVARAQGARDESAGVTAPPAEGLQPPSLTTFEETATAWHDQSQPAAWPEPPALTPFPTIAGSGDWPTAPVPEAAPPTTPLSSRAPARQLRDAASPTAPALPPTAAAAPAPEVAPSAEAPTAQAVEAPSAVEAPPAPAAAPSGPEPAAAGPNAVDLAAEIMMIQKALETEPNRADLHRKLGFLLARQGRTAEAATEFRKALQYSRTSL